MRQGIGIEAERETQHGVQGSNTKRKRMKIPKANEMKWGIEWGRIMGWEVPFYSEMKLRRVKRIYK